MHICANIPMKNKIAQLRRKGRRKIKTDRQTLLNRCIQYIHIFEYSNTYLNAQTCQPTNKKQDGVAEEKGAKEDQDRHTDSTESMR
jgi:hypothetical protein